MSNGNEYSPKLTDYESELIGQLRNEAAEVKDCFTKFSFQAISLSSIGLALLIRYQPAEPLLGLSSLFVIFIALSVARIGTHKYGTANRHYGYELHLYRVCRLKFSEEHGWKSSYRNLGWEEALRAWRIVQATVFQHLYTHAAGEPNKLKEFAKEIEHPWFDVSMLMHSKVAYYAGSYLKTVFSMFYIIIGCGLISLLAMVVQFFIVYGTWAGISGSFLFILIVFETSKQGRVLSARRKLLESGILSIHSCAIMWQLVALAHYRALESLPGYYDGKVDKFRGYTHQLSLQTLSLIDYIQPKSDIQDWIDGNFTKRNT